LKTVALANDCCFVDILNAWGGNFQYPYTQLGYYQVDGVHPYKFGYQNIADTLAGLIL